MTLHGKVIIYCTYVVHGVFIGVTATTYIIIGVTFLPRQKHREQDVQRRVRKTFYVSVSLITAFTMFIMLPNYIQVQAASGTANTMKVLLTYIGHSVDPLLYVFLDKTLRPIAISFVTCKKFTNNVEDKLTEGLLFSLGVNDSLLIETDVSPKQYRRYVESFRETLV